MKKQKLSLGKVRKETKCFTTGIDRIYSGTVTIEHETEKAILVQFTGTITDIWYDGEEEIEEREEQEWIPKSIATITEEAIYIEEWKKLSHCMEQVAE